jgi:hypothetical protein
LVITVVFAVNPMILLYSGNGMSEALYLFTLVATTRYLSRWLRRDDLRSLVYAGVALGFCYLARNEAVLPAALAVSIVLVVGYRRGTGERNPRLMRAMTDAVIFLLPFVASFVGWAVASYVITGQFFAQFSSPYGTSAQIAAGGGAGTRFPFGGELRLEAHALEYLAPLLAVIVVVALAKGIVRRDPLVLVPIAVVGGGLAFDMASYLTNNIIWSFRYMIATVPLEMLLVGFILAAAPIREAASGGSRRRMALSRAKEGRPWIVSAIGVLVAVVTLGPSVPATAEGMLHPVLGFQEIEEVGYVFHHPLTKQDRVDKDHYPDILSIADYLGRLRLPDQDVIVDNSSECVPEIIVNVPNPKMFVIPNDQDFQRSLADPLTFHVHYILVPPDTDLNINATTDKTYPSLYQTGDGFAQEVHQFPAGGVCTAFRLYRVVGHPAAA